MATVSKLQLAIRVAQKTGLPQKQALRFVQNTLDEITKSLVSGDTPVLRNFGTFEVIRRKAKIGRNPKRPECDVPIPARTVVKFSPGKLLAKLVNKP